MAVRERQPPVVDLRAAAGAENPPCPVCGDPLFGWALLRPSAEPVRRCETCGLGLAGPPAAQDEAREQLALLQRQGAARIPNRASLQAWLGQSGWAALGPESRLLFTPEALRRLDAGPARSRPAIATMWQTLLNALTFGHNVALGALRGSPATRAAAGWQRGLDVFISVVLSLPVAIVAAPLELGAALFGRGGLLELEAQAETSSPAAAASSAAPPS